MCVMYRKKIKIHIKHQQQLPLDSENNFLFLLSFLNIYNKHCIQKDFPYDEYFWLFYRTLIILKINQDTNIIFLTIQSPK